MPENFKDVVDVIDRLWACEDAQCVFDVTDAYGKSLGFKATVIASHGRMLIESNNLPPLFTSLPREWGERVVELDLYTIDPIMQMSSRSCRPFTYAEACFDPTPRVKEFIKEIKAIGVEFGWAVPVHTSGMAPGVVSFGGPTEILLDPAAQVRLFMVSMLAYQRVSESFAKMIPEIGMTLTDRERAVLTLVARGKTNWEIGKVLSISEYSVRDYLKRLAVKLETSNRTHAVARAMQLGLIVP